MQNELILDDVYDVWFTSFWQTPLGYAILVLLALVACLVVYGILKLIQAYRGSTKERSLRMLKALAGKVKKGQVDTKKVYQELTNVIKSYTQWRYGLPRGMTDYELAALLAQTDCKIKLREEVNRVLADAQMIKFGPVEALKSQVEQDIAAIISFVEETAKGK